MSTSRQIKERLALLREDHPAQDDNELNQATSRRAESENVECIDVSGRPVSLNGELDKEANQRFGREANTLFRAEANEKFATPINQAKRAAAQTEVDKIRAYSSYLSAGIGLIMAYGAADFGFPVSFAVGVVSVLAINDSLPYVFDKLEDYVASSAEASVQIKVKAVY